MNYAVVVEQLKSVPEAETLLSSESRDDTDDASETIGSGIGAPDSDPLASSTPEDTRSTKRPLPQTTQRISKKRALEDDLMIKTVAALQDMVKSPHQPTPLVRDEEQVFADFIASSLRGMNNPHFKKATMINIQTCILDGMKACMTPVQSPYYQQPSSTHPFGQLNPAYENQSPKLPSFMQPMPPMPSYVNQAHRMTSLQIGQACQPSTSIWSHLPTDFVNPTRHMMGERSDSCSGSTADSQVSPVSVISVNEDDETKNFYAI